MTISVSRMLRFQPRDYVVAWWMPAARLPGSFEKARPDTRTTGKNGFPLSCTRGFKAGRERAAYRVSPRENPTKFDLTKNHETCVLPVRLKEKQADWC